MNKIVIRPAELSDAAALLAIYEPYVKNTAVSFEYEVPSVEEFRQRIATIRQQYPYLVAEQDGRIVGYTYANTFKQRAAYLHSVETTIYLSADHKHQGIGSALYRALEERLTKQNITNCNACIAYTEHPDQTLNNDSMKFHEAMGYRLVGTFHKCGCKFGRWYDMIWMEKFLAPHTVPPQDFVPHSSL